MSSDFIGEFAQKLIKHGFANQALPLQGCSSAEIEEIQNASKVKLPQIYRAFLQTMGRSTGEFLRGDERCYPQLLTLRQDAEGLLEEERATTQFKLSATDFVFWMSQGTQFFFFDTAGGDDPAVWHFREGYENPMRRWDHYSEALTYLLNEQIKVQEQIEKLR